jgi:hypothetical protein
MKSYLQFEKFDKQLIKPLQLHHLKIKKFLSKNQPIHLYNLNDKLTNK